MIKEILRAKADYPGMTKDQVIAEIEFKHKESMDDYCLQLIHDIYNYNRVLLRIVK